MSQLTNGGVEFLTDTSTITQKTTWSVTSKTTASTGLNQNYSFENDLSVTAQVGVKAFGSVGGGYDIDLSGSYGLSTLTKNITSLGLSTGLQISKPGTFASFQNYGYLVAPYIVGTTQPGGVVDSQPLPTDIQTFGLLRAIFTADPLASDAGGWWQQAYSQAPDVSLNHPSRWQESTPSLTNPIPSNCLATGTGSSQMDCMELSPRSPDNPWLSPFHQMRGFFISSAAFPGQGPQSQMAKAGDVLSLQTRLYNYSLAAMAPPKASPNTQVHVRFYFTPWNQTVAAGDSVSITEQTLAPIPPFSDSQGAPPNWVLARTTFDTSQFEQTKNGNVSLVFWVVVWMQTPDGKLVPEMPGHGLTGVPGTLKSFADAAKLEECQTDEKGQRDENHCYSNNLGLYHQVFYIAAPVSGAVPGPLAAVTGTASVDISRVEVPTQQINLNANMVISATLAPSAEGVAGVTANFYDGDPQHGGRLFDVEQIPYIPKNQSYLVETLYRAKTCGVHELFVEVSAGQHKVVQRAPTINVACSTPQ